MDDACTLLSPSLLSLLVFFAFDVFIDIVVVVVDVVFDGLFIYDCDNGMVHAARAQCRYHFTYCFQFEVFIARFLWCFV